MTPLLNNLLLADIEKVVGFVFGLIVLVLWIIGQIASAKKGAARPVAPQPQRKPAPPPPQRVQPANAAAGPAGQQADPLRNQVEEFLRRAGRAQQPNQPRAVERPPQPAAEQIQILIDDEPPTSDRKSLAEPLRPLAERDAQQPARKTQSFPPRRPRPTSEPPGRSVAEHVSEHITAGSQAVAAQASHLGRRIIEDDAQFDVQLKAKFDHKVGTLAASRPRDEEQAAAPRVTPAAQIAALLASPDGVRQAVVLNEILRRPSDNW